VIKNLKLSDPVVASEAFLAEVRSLRATDWDSWLIEAEVLSEAARTLERKGRKGVKLLMGIIEPKTASPGGDSDDDHEGIHRRAYLQARQYQVSQMLRGMALECILKGAIVARTQERPPATHHLQRLFESLGLSQMSEKEATMLIAIERMNQQGRYPYDRSENLKYVGMGFDIRTYHALVARVLVSFELSIAKHPGVDYSSLSRRITSLMQ
jgi:hypothetical protein